MNLSITSATSIIGFLVIFTGGIVTAYDLRQDVDTNTTYREIQTFKVLKIRKQHRDLTYEEWITFCNVGNKLKAFQACPSRYKIKDIRPRDRRTE
jgi:hypothetical protein